MHVMHWVINIAGGSEHMKEYAMLVILAAAKSAKYPTNFSATRAKVLVVMILSTTAAMGFLTSFMLSPSNHDIIAKLAVVQKGYNPPAI